MAGLVTCPAQAIGNSRLVDYGWYGYQGDGSSQDYGGQDYGGWGYGDGEQSPNTDTGTSASASESRGVVVIDTRLYTGSSAAGTGVVLTASGTVLTNYHVVEGSTSIKVTVASTGTTYTAKLVGADQSSDIAVLQLQGASGLTTATLDDDDLNVGDDVTAVGNAGGTGTLTAADGEVTAVDQKITTEAEDTVASETLTGLIETDADVQAGDSGGPLLDDEGEVTGIDTAASAGGTVQGYAIPIDDAMTIVRQIESGTATQDVRIGAAAYLGVQVTDGSLGDSYGPYGSSNSASGAEVVGVQTGTPAETAGITEGSVITKVGSTAISSADDLTAALATHRPGDKVQAEWTDASGQDHTATITLGSSPVN